MANLLSPTYRKIDSTLRHGTIPIVIEQAVSPPEEDTS